MNNDFKHLENKIVYFYKVHASFFESSLEWCSKPLKNRTTKITSIIHDQDNFYNILCTNKESPSDFYYNDKFNYFITEMVKDSDVSTGYIIISDKMVSIYKALYNIIQHKRKGSVAIKTSFGDQYFITREFYSFKQKLSCTKYFEKYPEDFL